MTTKSDCILREDGVVIETIQRQPDGSCCVIIQIPVHVTFMESFVWKRDAHDFFCELLQPLGLIPIKWESLYDIPKRMWTTRCNAQPIQEPQP